jgi:hypothetical protein
MKPEYGYVKTSLELKESTLHSGLCDTEYQFITMAFRADCNTATEKKSKLIKTQKRTERGKCTTTTHDKSN